MAGPDKPGTRRAELEIVSVGEHLLVLLHFGETGWSRSGKHTSTTDLTHNDDGLGRARVAVALQRLNLNDSVALGVTAHAGTGAS
jgi:hypothetical protein